MTSGSENVKINEDGTYGPIDPSKPWVLQTDYFPSQHSTDLPDWIGKALSAVLGFVIMLGLLLLCYVVFLTIKSIGGPKYVPPRGYQQVYVGQTFALTNGEVWTVSSMRGSCSMVLSTNASDVK